MSPRQERAVRTREIVLDAAAAEFDAHGYAGARMDRIVERTGLTKGAVYFHFKSKAALAEEFLSGKFELWLPLIQEISSSGLRGHEAACVLSKRVALAFRDDIRVRAGLRLSRERADPSGAAIYASWADVTAGLLDQGVADGTLRAELDVPAAARIAVRAFFGLYMVGAETGELAQIEADIDRLWDHLYTGMRSA